MEQMTVPFTIIGFCITGVLINVLVSFRVSGTKFLTPATEGRELEDPAYDCTVPWQKDPPEESSSTHKATKQNKLEKPERGTDLPATTALLPSSMLSYGLVMDGSVFWEPHPCRRDTSGLHLIPKPKSK